jgi:mRNA interferase MazF
VQADRLSRTGIATAIVAVVTSNTALAEFPGNVFLPMTVSGLPRDSAINVSQLVTVDREFIGEPIGQLPPLLLDELDAGLRLVLAI